MWTLFAVSRNKVSYRLNLLLEKWERVGESHKIVGQQNNIRQQYHTKLSESFQDDSFSLRVGCGFLYHKKHISIYLLYFQAFWNLIFYVGIKHWGLGPLHLVIVYRKLAIYVELVQAKIWQSLWNIDDLNWTISCEFLIFQFKP